MSHSLFETASFPLTLLRQWNSWKPIWQWQNRCQLKHVLTHTSILLSLYLLMQQKKIFVLTFPMVVHFSDNSIYIIKKTVLFYFSSELQRDRLIAQNQLWISLATFDLHLQRLDTRKFKCNLQITEYVLILLKSQSSPIDKMKCPAATIKIKYNLV